MADCPYCDEWRYDPSAEGIYVRPVGHRFPVIYRGGELRQASGDEAPDGRSEATAAHIAREHWLEPAVVVFGPLEEYAPMGALGWALNALLGR